MAKEKLSRRPLLQMSSADFRDSVAMSTNLTVSGTIASSGAATVGGTFTASSSALVSGTLTVSKTLTASSQATVSGTFTASSSALVSGGLTVSGTITGSTNMTVAGTLTPSSNLSPARGVTNPRTVASSSANLPSYGLITISGTAALAMIIDAPVAGRTVDIYKTANSTSIASITTNATGVTYNGTNTILTFDAQNQWIRLLGDSSTRWLMLGTTATFGGIS